METRTGQCAKCGQPFEYEWKGRSHTVCPACMRANMREASQRVRQRRKRKAGEEHGRTLDADGVSLMDREKVGRMLGIGTEMVRQLERDALLKIRRHPEARALWELWKEEGAPTPGAQVEAGEELLDREMELAEWNAVYDTLAEMNELDKAAGGEGCEGELAALRGELERCAAVITAATEAGAWGRAMDWGCTEI